VLYADDTQKGPNLTARSSKKPEEGEDVHKRVAGGGMPSFHRSKSGWAKMVKNRTLSGLTLRGRWLEIGTEEVSVTIKKSLY